MKKPTNSKGLWLRLGGTILSIGLLIWLIASQNTNDLISVFQRIPTRSLVAMVFLMTLSRLAVIGRWYALLRSGNANISLNQSAKLTMAGLFATNFLPTTIGGDVVRLVGLVRLGIDSSLGTASLVVDRLVGMTGMALALPWSLPFLPQAATSSVSLAAAPLWANRILDKTRHFVSSTFEALLRWIKQPGGLAASFACTVIHTLCFFGIQWLALGGMGEPLRFSTVAGLFVLVYFVTLLPISINGYGLQELSVTLVYSQLAGVSQETSLTAALILRTLTMAASLPGAFFLSGLITPQKGQTKEINFFHEA